MPFRFRRPNLDDAARLLAWRTRPEITRFMVTDLEPDLERQQQWLQHCAACKDYEHFLIYLEDEAVGYLSYSEIDRTHRHCSSGSYLISGTKTRLMAGFLYPFILDYAFFRLDMHKILNTFLEGNDKVIAIQEQIGFRRVGVQRQHVWKYQRWHDLWLFEMLREEWEQRPPLFPRSHTLAAFED